MPNLLLINTVLYAALSLHSSNCLIVSHASTVKFNKVRVLRVKGKSKRSRYRIKRRPNWKKAYVSLMEGQSIEVGTE